MESLTIVAKRKWCGTFVFFIFLFFVCLPVPVSESQNEKKEYLTAEELLRTEAGQFFVTRQFEEALKEFQKLEKEYPKDIIIKRYIGASLDHLKRDEEAIAAFEKVLKLNSDDLPSRQFLAKIYLRKGDLGKAEREFTFLVEHDKTGAFGPAARAEVAKIKQLRLTQEKAVQIAGRKISPQDFLQTKAAEHFRNARFEEALDELKKLEEKYSGDPLIVRYQAMTLDKLGRTDEAIQKFREGLTAVPDNIALHYFLGQTLLRKRDFEGAKREFEYVVANDESEAYRITARADLKAVDKIISDQKKAKRRWKFDASAKVEWLRNPGSTPKHVGFRSGRGVYSSGKISNTLGLTYRLFTKGPWSGKMGYSYSEAFYTRSFSHLNTFGNTLTGNLTYSRNFLGKPLLIDVGHSTAHTMLREQYYTTAFSETASFIYSPVSWNRLIFSEKWAFTTYDGDGTSP
ncbi:MAG: tetratricopeptide repeat protein, partial [Candidatus Omnitrophica bacterium]|nr:tetratricopeptide repeat protein [Candidatus Omnitrophota bacterium]